VALAFGCTDPSSHAGLRRLGPVAFFCARMRAVERDALAAARRHPWVRRRVTEGRQALRRAESAAEAEVESAVRKAA
jgi:hypothetical protein